MKPIIISLDDVSLRYGGWEEIKEFHKRNPKSKFTLFVIPKGNDEEYLKEINKPWAELVFHGGHSGGSLRWDKEETKKYFLEYQKYGFAKGFKAPGWRLTDAHVGVCRELDFWICHYFDGILRNENIEYWITKPPWDKDLRIYDNYVEYFSHVQYWDRSIDKLESFVRDNEVEYKFISEAINEKIQ